jgi:hypothetical protein
MNNTSIKPGDVFISEKHARSFTKTIYEFNVVVKIENNTVTYHLNNRLFSAPIATFILWANSPDVIKC